VSRYAGWLRTGAELIGSLWFLVMFGAFVLQVFTRYVLGAPLGWTTEVCLIAYLWFAFWGAGLMVRERDHVRFDMIYQMLPDKGRRIVAMVTSLAMGGLFVAALPANIDFVTFMGEDVTWVLEIRFDLVFAVFIVFMVGFAVVALGRAARLAGRGWRDEIR